MQIQMTGQNMELTPAIRSYMEKKFQRVSAVADRITSVQITFHVEKLTQIAKANLNLPGTQIHAESKSEDMYESIDKLVDKLLQQIKKHKEKNS